MVQERRAFRKPSLTHYPLGDESGKLSGTSIAKRRSGNAKIEREAETPELLAKYLRHIGQGNLLTHEEEIDLSKRAKQGDKRARKRL
ncbi:MAG: hypothetical protein M3M97_04745, partial [Actinomycetota bacterium]|nr:hypothetical protein [Actinomycetota bacterium]